MALPDGTAAPPCGAKTRRGTRCQLAAGFGTDHPGYGPCSRHGGHLPGPKKAAAMEMARTELRFMGYPVEIEPTDSLLLCVRVAAGHLAYLTGQLATVDNPLEERKGGQVLHIWGRLQQEAVDRLARVSEAAIRAGVAERRVRLAERAGSHIAQALEDALASVDLPAAQRGRLARAFATKLAVLEQSDEGEVWEGTAS